MQLLFLNLASSSSSSSSSSSTIIFSVLVSLLFQIIQAGNNLPNNVKFPAALVFGDSIVDPGNNNNISTVVKCDFRPYGRDFMGGIPTGRFSNGKIPTDMIGLGIKELLPAYLDANLQPQDLPTGVSFASGAAGYDPLTSKLASVISMSHQLGLFRKYIGELKAVVGDERSATILSESLYLVVAGSDDIANTYFPTPFRKLKYDIPAYTDLMIRSASTFLQKLYGLGARRIVVVSIPPIGCVPSQRTLAGGIYKGCAEQHNQAAKLFNSKLSSLLDSMNKKLPQARVLYIDIYYALLRLIHNPSAYGFEEVTKGCCGTGRLEVSILCTDENPFTCEDATKYLFWDSYHPTESGYKVLLGPIIQNIKSFF